MTERGQKLTKQAMGIDEGLPLNASEGGIEQLRDDIQRLLDMEAIRQLKYAYFRCVDTANLEELATLLHVDVSVDFQGAHYHWQCQGRQAYIDNIAAAVHPRAIAQHHGHHPEIQMLSGTEATAIWYLEDKFWLVDQAFFTQGTALYWDRYLKRDGRWRIIETRYRRIYEFSEPLAQAPAPASHYLGEFGATPDA